MTSSFCDITDPAELRALVQDGVTCEECGSKGRFHLDGKCTTCHGTGHMSLPSPDLEALAVCWCEGKEISCSLTGSGIWKCGTSEEPYIRWVLPPPYTTDPVAAMRLAVKYQVGLDVQGYTQITAFVLETDINVKEKKDTVHLRCLVLTKAALLAALTEAIEGASDV